MCGHEMTAHRNPISVFRSLSLSVPRLESKGRGMRDAERAQRGDAIGLVHAFDGYDLSNHETWRATQTDHGKIQHIYGTVDKSACMVGMNGMSHQALTT